MSRGANEASTRGGAERRTHTLGIHRCVKTIENISRIRMVVARASATLMASSLKQNKFWTKLLFRWRNSAHGRPPPPTRIVPHGRGIPEEFLDYCSGCGIPVLDPPPPPTSAERGMIQMPTYFHSAHGGLHPCFIRFFGYLPSSVGSFWRHFEGTLVKKAFIEGYLELGWL